MYGGKYINYTLCNTLYHTLCKPYGYTDQDTDTDKETNTPPTPPTGGGGSVLKKYKYPEWLNLDQWQKFCSMRTRIKKPITTEETIKRLMSCLKGLMDNGYKQEQLFADAIDNCWQKFYQPKGQVLGSSKGVSSSYPVCGKCKMEADNITRGQPCPYCGEIA